MFFLFLKPRCTLKLVPGQHTCVTWLKCRFSCLMASDWLHQNNRRPQAECSEPHPSTGERKEHAQVATTLSDTIAFNLMPVKHQRRTRFLLWTEFLMQPLNSGIWFRYTLSSDAAEPNANTMPSSSLYTN